MRTLSPYGSYALIVGEHYSPEQVMGMARFILARSSYYGEVEENPEKFELPEPVLLEFEKYLRMEEPQALAEFVSWKAGAAFSQRLWTAYQGFQSRAMFDSHVKDFGKDVTPPERKPNLKKGRKSSLNIFRARGVRK